MDTWQSPHKDLTQEWHYGLNRCKFSNSHPAPTTEEEHQLLSWDLTTIPKHTHFISHMLP
jgi:hypothetical protein